MMLKAGIWHDINKCEELSENIRDGCEKNTELVVRAAEGSAYFLEERASLRMRRRMDLHVPDIFE